MSTTPGEGSAIPAGVEIEEVVAMPTVSTEARINEIQNRLLKPGISEDEVRRLEKILAVLRDSD